MKASPLKKLSISQPEIEQFLSVKDSYLHLKRRLETQEQAFKSLEADIIQKIECGADISRCGFAVAVKTCERRYPRWKEVYIETCGKERADEILNSTPPTIYKNLVVS